MLNRGARKAIISVLFLAFIISIVFQFFHDEFLSRISIRHDNGSIAHIISVAEKVAKMDKTEKIDLNTLKEKNLIDRPIVISVKRVGGKLKLLDSIVFEGKIIDSGYFTVVKNGAWIKTTRFYNQKYPIDCEGVMKESANKLFIYKCWYINK